MTGLAGLGIQLRSTQPGEHRCRCPRCRETKNRRHDAALAVRLATDGSAVWTCFRCAWSGAVGADRHHERRPQARAAAPGPDRKGALEAALRLWRSASPIAEDCPVGRYLLGRGCPLPPDGADLRWLPAYRHPSGWCGPAMLGLITDVLTGEPMSLHFTWIRGDGGGKAPIERPRLMAKGLPCRGVVRLTDDASLTLGLAAGEGVETCLAASLAFGASVWACLSAGTLAWLPVLDGIESLTVIADADGPDTHGRRAGEAAAIEVGRRWREAGAEVRVWLPDGEGIDFADLAREIAA